MEGPSSKSRRINENPHGRDAQIQRLMHIGSTSTRSLQKIIKELLGNAPSAADLWRTSQALFSECQHAIELECTDGGTFTWKLAHPSKLLALVISRSPALQAMYLSALAKKPCSMERPWSLVVGFDECSPGNKLNTQNRRKIMNLSFSFIELGAQALAKEDSWMTAVSVRSTVIAKVSGGWSYMLREFLHLQLASAQGLQTSGVALDLQGVPCLLYARLTHLLTDGDGFKQALQWKGASGIKPCMRHPNVFKKNSDLSHRRPSFCDVTCANSQSFKRWGVGEFETAADVLVAARRQYDEGVLTEGCA